MRGNLTGSEPAEDTWGRTGLRAEPTLTAHDEHVLTDHHGSGGESKICGTRSNFEQLLKSLTTSYVGTAMQPCVTLH